MHRCRSAGIRAKTIFPQMPDGPTWGPVTSIWIFWAFFASSGLSNENRRISMLNNTMYCIIYMYHVCWLCGWNDKIHLIQVTAWLNLVCRPCSWFRSCWPCPRAPSVANIDVLDLLLFRRHRHDAHAHAHAHRHAHRHDHRQVSLRRQNQQKSFVQATSFRGTS